MKFYHESADLFVPDGTTETEALQRVTHLGIGAHQDDLEFMAFHGISACYDQADQWFGGVTCTNGGGSARAGKFASYTDEQMQSVRRAEQKEAARIGHYAAVIQLDYPSAEIKGTGQAQLVDDLIAICKATRPNLLYTHNPADKHDSHLAVFAAVLRALRALPAEQRPQSIIGCEVWRGLDWMLDEDKVVMDVSGRDELARALNGVFASQIEGGKRYDLATMGRRLANATFFASHQTDRSDQIWFGMDLTALIQNDQLDPVVYVDRYTQRFAHDVKSKLTRFTGNLK